MPHKHKRKRDADIESFDLPPTQQARALPVKPKNKDSVKSQSDRRSTKLKQQRKANDAPRAFRRLMAVAHGAKIRSGLDNGEAKPPKQPKATAATPRINPGEDLRSFANRVDAALPIAGLTTKTTVKDGRDTMGFKVYRTRKERQMHKLYDQWRAEERKLSDEREDALEEAAEDELNNDVEGFSSLTKSLEAQSTERGKGKRSRSGKRRHGGDEDPWAEVSRRRSETKPGLHDVAQAPPQLPHTRTGRGQVVVSGAAVKVTDVPKAAGSLKRREDLQSAREHVVEAYRKLRDHEQAKLDGLDKAKLKN